MTQWKEINPGTVEVLSWKLKQYIAYSYEEEHEDFEILHYWSNHNEVVENMIHILVHNICVWTLLDYEFRNNPMDPEQIEDKLRKKERLPGFIYWKNFIVIHSKSENRKIVYKTEEVSFKLLWSVRNPYQSLQEQFENSTVDKICDIPWYEGLYYLDKYNQICSYGRFTVSNWWNYRREWRKLKYYRAGGWWVGLARKKYYCVELANTDRKPKVFFVHRLLYAIHNNIPYSEAKRIRFLDWDSYNIKIENLVHYKDM